MLHISVIIPAYKDWPRLKLCLEALAKQTYPADKFEVIVVNNDQEESCPYELPAANMKIITEDKPGSYAARNAGIKIANGELLAFTDSDCIPDIDWIRNALEVFTVEPALDRIAGKIETFRVKGTSDLIFKYQQLFSMNQESYVQNLGSGITANMFSRRYVFEKVGLFREDLYSGGDNEWGMRAFQKDCSIKYLDDVVVNHPSRKSFRELMRKKRRTTGGLYQLRFKHASFFTKSKILFRQLLPPVSGIRKLERRDGLITNLILFSILWLNKLTGFTELFKLSFFGKKRRRS